MIAPTATLTWFARHEFRLAWRDWLWMMTAGKRRRARIVAVVLVLFAGFMHLFAYSMVAGFAHTAAPPDKPALVALTAGVLLAFSLMLSQAMEQVTRAFYTRADLDLILSSPVAVSQVFAVRIAALARLHHAARLGAGGAVHRRSGLRRGAALVSGLWRGGGDRQLRLRAGGGADGRAVPPDRAEAHAAGGADRGGGDRRRLHHRAAGGGDPVLRHAVALRAAALRYAHAARPGARQFRSGGRRAPRSATGRRSPRCWARAC